MYIMKILLMRAMIITVSSIEEDNGEESVLVSLRVDLRQRHNEWQIWSYSGLMSAAGPSGRLTNYVCACVCVCVSGAHTLGTYVYTYHLHQQPRKCRQTSLYIIINLSIYVNPLQKLLCILPGNMQLLTKNRTSPVTDYTPTTASLMYSTKTVVYTHTNRYWTIEPLSGRQVVSYPAYFVYWLLNEYSSWTIIKMQEITSIYDVRKFIYKRPYVALISSIVICGRYLKSSFRRFISICHCHLIQAQRRNPSLH